LPAFVNECAQRPEIKPAVLRHCHHLQRVYNHAAPVVLSKAQVEVNEQVRRLPAKYHVEIIVRRVVCRDYQKRHVVQV